MWLGCHDGASYRDRQFDRAEERFRIEVVVAGFIDNPQHAVLLGGGVAQRDVDFALLQRDRISVVVHANDQLFCSCLCHSSKQVLDLELFSPNPGSLIPAYLCNVDRAIG